MSKSYKTMLSIVCILLVACVSLGVAYLFYDKEVSEETIVLVDGNLSINFLNGNVIKAKEENEYSMSFSVTNNSNAVASYSINVANVHNKVDSVLVSITNSYSNSVISEGALPQEDSALVNNIQIGSGETHTYNINIKQDSTDSYEAVLKINEEKPTIETFAQTILKNNAVSSTTLTKVGEEAATEDEGLISDIDDSGSTYYFRGAATNNYVSFADLTWRIVRINGDGTVKLILNKTVDTVQPYYSNTDEGFDTYNNSTIKTYLTSWYEYNLENYDDYISLDKYCNDYTTTNDTDNIYSSYVRNITNKIPTFNCLGKNVGVKVGLLTADEAIYAGALYQTNNTTYYLHNDDITTAWWTMTPATLTSTSMNPFIITDSGSLDSNVVGNYNRGVRPVISLIKDIEVSGNGSANNPYTIKTTDK